MLHNSLASNHYLLVKANLYELSISKSKLSKFFMDTFTNLTSGITATPIANRCVKLSV